VEAPKASTPHPHAEGEYHFETGVDGENAGNWLSDQRIGFNLSLGRRDQRNVSRDGAYDRYVSLMWRRSWTTLSKYTRKSRRAGLRKEETEGVDPLDDTRNVHDRVVYHEHQKETARKEVSCPVEFGDS